MVLRNTEQSSYRPRAHTQPQSPQLKTKLRAKPPATPTEAREVKFVKKAACSFKAKPVNKAVLNSAGDLGVKRVQKHKPTQAAPFSLCDRPDPMEARERAAAQAAAALAAQRKFTAKPVPRQMYGAGIPVVHKKPVTQPEPFDLPGDALHEAAQRELAEKQVQAELEREQATLFKAAKPSSAIARPYVPTIVSKPPTTAQPFRLVTNTRVGERSHFDVNQKQKRARQEEQDAAATREQEDREVKKLRQGLVHKANPVPYRSMRV